MTSRRRRSCVLVFSFLLVAATFASAAIASGYAPRVGDSFTYSESITVNNGQGSYTGYTDLTSATGTETVDSVNGTNVLTHYSSSSSFSNNQGNSFTNSSSGDFVWSATSYQYVNGTDNQVGYTKPIYVWFAVNPSLPVSGTFFVLNTQFTVLSKNFSYEVHGNGVGWAQTIRAEGSGQYQRHDSYGTFTASYTWDEYFDSATGYIVGYHYVEQDSGEYQGQPGSFTYTDDLNVVSTTYALAPANPSTVTLTSSVSTGSSGSGPDVGTILVGAFLVVVVVIAVAYAATRRGRKENLPEHPPPPPTSAPATWQSNVDLGSRPPEQVVIRDVAKVNCRYCGTLIPTTADTCPYCGGPRR